MKKRGKVLLAVLAGLLLVVLVGGLLIGNFFVELALNPSTDKTAVLQAEHNDVDYGDGAQQRHQEDRAWFDDIGYQQVKLTSHDGLLLNAYAVQQQAEDSSWVIIAHGYNGSGRQMVSSARIFYNKGYSVLLPDARACGQSQGTYLGMGWPERRDMVAWAQLLNQQYAPRNIVLYGVSMGGATVMMAAGEADLPANVRAVVEDCGYTSAYDEFSYQLKAIFGLPPFPLMHFATVVAWAKAGYWLWDASAEAQVAQSTTPILFIHGENDTFVPAAMVNAVYAAAGSEKEKLVVPGAGHGGAATANPALYWGTVDAFLARYLQQ